jgi:hypothetical protein
MTACIYSCDLVLLLTTLVVCVVDMGDVCVVVLVYVGWCVGVGAGGHVLGHTAFCSSPSRTRFRSRSPSRQGGRHRPTG